MEKQDDVQSLKICIYRNELIKTMRYFQKISTRYHYSSYNSDILWVASKLENKFPEEILEFHKTSTGNLDISTSRNDYKSKAEVVKRVQHVLVNVMKKPDDWKKYALTIKSANIKRPAFQEEFSKVFPEWEELK